MYVAVFYDPTNINGKLVVTLVGQFDNSHAVVLGCPIGFGFDCGHPVAHVRLRDGSGTERLRLSVSEDGEAEILFYDDEGEVVRRIGAD